MHNLCRYQPAGERWNSKGCSTEKSSPGEARYVIKTDIRFILAAGGREDLFSEVTTGVLVGMFICLSL